MEASFTPSSSPPAMSSLPTFLAFTFSPPAVSTRAPARRVASRARPSPPTTMAQTSTVAPMSFDKGTRTNPYRIGVLPGDGVGPDVVRATLRVLGALSEYTELNLEYEQGLFGADAVAETGTEVPDETVELCNRSDAVLRGYQGSSRGTANKGADGMSGHVKLGEKLNLFAQLRPVLVYPQLIAESPLRAHLVEGLDLMLVREVSAGALRYKEESMMEADRASSTFSYTGDEVSRVAEVALNVAEARSGRVTNVDIADRIDVSSFWRSKMHQFFREKTTGRADIQFSDMFVDDFCREIICHPKKFDVIVTSNLFGDMIAEVMAALSGPLRLSPSAWFSSRGFSVYGPADIFNASAYPRSGGNGANGSTGGALSTNPVAMIRSASMMLRYALNEPAAADLLQKAIMKVLRDVEEGGPGSAGVLEADQFAEAMIRELALMRQFEMVCNPGECGE